MCNVYNPIGTISTIKNHLQKNDIDEFKSLNELINFQKNGGIFSSIVIPAEQPIFYPESNRSDRVFPEIIQTFR